MKKCVVLWLVMLMFVSLCGQGALAQRPEKLETVRFVLFGTMTKGMEDFLKNDLNPRLREEINTEIELQYIPWGEFGPGKKIDLMLAAGEDFDATLSNATWLNLLIQKRMAQDLTGVAKQYTQDLQKNVAQAAFDSFRFAGKLYALPVGNKPRADQFYSIAVRQDLLEEVGMKEITSIADLDQYFYLVKGKYPDMYASANYQLRTFIRGYSDRQLTVLEGNNPWLFLVDQKSAEGNLIPIWETEEFKTHVQYTRKWYQDGLIPRDILTNTTGDVTRFETGQFMAMRGTCLTSVTENQPNLQKNVPTGRIQEYLFGADRPKYKIQYESTAFMVPAYSKKADRVAMIVNLMQKNQEWADFFVYGVKDRDYTLDENGRITRILKDDLFYMWALFNIKFPRFTATVPQEWVGAYTAWDDNAQPSQAFGFFQDLTSIKTEKAQAEAVAKEYLDPMMVGMVDYEPGVQKLREEMQKAGFETYYAEVLKQFKAYRASKK